jgi:hypothetical protein
MQVFRLPEFRYWDDGDLPPRFGGHSTEIFKENVEGMFFCGVEAEGYVDGSVRFGDPIPISISIIREVIRQGQTRHGFIREGQTRHGFRTTNEHQ